MENKNGRGIFLGVVSVATLIVAIIGATFAYFSAQVSSNTGDIAGDTLDLGASALQLSVTKMTTAQLGGTLTGTEATNLVPGAITETDAGYAAAVSAHCEGTVDGTSNTNKYTGCHVYEVAVTSSNALTNAQLSAALQLTDNTLDDDNWSYALLQTSSITTAATSGTAPALASLKTGNDGATPTPQATGVHRFNDGREQMLVTENLGATTTYYYLVVYLLNTSSSQNNGGGTGATNEAGSYTGTITLSAGGGTVKASFGTGV